MRHHKAVDYKAADYKAVVVPELFEIAHKFWHAVLMRRNKGGIGKAGAANPALRAAEFTGLFVFAARAFHQYLMGLFQ